MGRNLLRIALLIFAIVGVSLLHYLTPLRLPMLHDIFQRLYYLPIILSAFWFGLRGGLIAAIAVSIIYAPHVLFQWGDRPTLELEKFLEIILYNVVGGVTGLLSQREEARRMQLQETARGLEDSYRKLQSQADLIIRIEQQLRRAERFSALGEMSAALAHEIRNPLGSIRGTAEILRDDFRPSDGKYEFLEILIKETDRLNRVVEDFLRLAKPVEPDRELFRIDSDLREIVALLHPEARARGVVLALDAPEPVELSGDREKLKQVFLNLLLNALQATDRGGEITVVVGCSNGNGEFRHAQVTVLDNGSGIDPALLPRIFEPFFTTKQGGTGLGLAIAQRIIESHGGTITVESRAGQGSSFTVTLPLVP